LIYWDITEDTWNWRKPYAINGELQEVPLSQILYYKRFQTIPGIERSLEFAVSFLGR
jgi:hypothetical protein